MCSVPLSRHCPNDCPAAVLALSRQVRTPRIRGSAGYAGFLLAVLANGSLPAREIECMAVDLREHLLQCRLQMRGSHPAREERFAPRARESANEYLKNQADLARAALRVRTREPRKPPKKGVRTW